MCLNVDLTSVTGFVLFTFSRNHFLEDCRYTILLILPNGQSCREVHGILNFVKKLSFLHPFLDSSIDILNVFKVSLLLRKKKLSFGFFLSRFNIFTTVFLGVSKYDWHFLSTDFCTCGNRLAPEPQVAV